jgi:hypothetical protein
MKNSFFIDVQSVRVASAFAGALARLSTLLAR